LNSPPSASPLSVAPQAAATGAASTHIRWRILAILMLIMAVTALCRLNLSIAGKYIEDEFSYNTLTMGRIFSAFLWGYAFFQIPWGYVGDRFGPRRILTISILCWSLGTLAMGIAPWMAGVAGLSVFWMFIFVRFLTGVGEAAVSCNVTRIIASWTAVRERGFANGLQIAGLGLGGSLTPIFISWTMVHWGWRNSFFLCGIIGLIVVALWRYYATDWPEQHPSVSAAELEVIHPGAERNVAHSRDRAPVRNAPWGKMLTSVSVWGLILGYGCQGYAFYVYYHWFYYYAVKVRGLALMEAAVWTSLPFIAISLLAPAGGWFSDRVARKLGRGRGRQCGGWVGMGTSAVLLFIGSHTANTSVALPLIAAAAGFNMFGGANFWASCIDLAPDYSASLSALMNTLGNAGGAISATVTAAVATQYNWSRALDLAALITVFSGLLWFFVDAGRSIEEGARGGILEARADVHMASPASTGRA
jgi:ACS family glucarate transporter-like MFS transporter